MYRGGIALTDVLLLGSPNAGKTTFFNELTHSHQKTGNWHGVTVSATEKRVGAYRIVDLPGLYSFQTGSMEERVSLKAFLDYKDAAVLQIVDAFSLKRSLRFTQELKARGVIPILVLTKCDLFSAAGGVLDAGRLSRETGLVILRKEDFSLSRLEEYRRQISEKVKFSFSGGYLPPTEKRSKAENLLCKPSVACIAFFLALFVTFFFCFYEYAPCSLCKRGIEILFSLANGWLAEIIPSDFIKGLLCDCLLSGVGSVLCFLPQIAGLYFCLSLMEESGLLSYAAFALDDLFSLFQLNGRAAFFLTMGFGCNTTAVTLTRGLPNADVQRRTVLAMQFVPCSARLPVLLTLLGGMAKNQWLTVVFLYLLCLCFSLTAAFLFRKGEERELLWELAPLQRPSWKKACKDLLFPVKQFIIKTGRVLLPCLIGIRLLSCFDLSLSLCAYEESILALVCQKTAILLSPLGCADWKIALALLSGFAAKENMAGTLSLFYPEGFPFSEGQLYALLVIIVLSPPCISCFAATVREVGLRYALLFFIGQTAVSYLCAVATYHLGAWASFLPLLLAVTFTLFIRKNHERIYGNRKHNAEKFYG